MPGWSRCPPVRESAAGAWVTPSAPRTSPCCWPPGPGRRGRTGTSAGLTSGSPSAARTPSTPCGRPTAGPTRGNASKSPAAVASAAPEPPWPRWPFSMAAPDGKLTVETVAHAYHGIGDQHHVQPRVISITQSTEMGTVYKPAEIEALARFAHERKMFLHIDGARISNAVAAQQLTLRQATRDLGVDVLSFGGTKNGLMGVEAVVFFRPELAADFLFVRKQGMQLASKMRYMSVQMEALLTDDLWRRNAEHANRMARLLEQEVKKIPRVKVVYPVEANGAFAQIPKEAIRMIHVRNDRY